ncbi:MAG: beta-propeller fold lactonase family protein [Sphingomonadales bacterium]|jgi:YVTN family beta-propeller protein
MRIVLSFIIWSMVALNASAQTLIVGNKGEDSVSFIDYANGVELKRLPTGPQPHEIALSPDGETVVVVSYGAKQLDVYDVQSQTHLKTIDIAPHSRPHGITYLKDGRHVVATTEGSEDIVIVDVDAAKVVQSIDTKQRGSHMLALTADESRAFVSNLGSGTVSVLDLNTGKKIKDLRSGVGPEGLAISPDGKELWVGNREENTVAIFDTQTLDLLAKTQVGDFPIRIAISPDGKRVVTSNFVSGDLTVLNRQTRQIEKTIKFSGTEPRPVTILFHPGGKHLFAALTGANQIAEVDLEAAVEVRRFQAGERSDGLGFSLIQ